MGLRITNRVKKSCSPPVSEAEQLDLLWSETQKWQRFHRNEDISTREKFIEKYQIVKKRLAGMLSPGENMVPEAERLNLSIRKKKNDPTKSHQHLDIATIVELLKSGNRD